MLDGFLLMVSMACSQWLICYAHDTSWHNSLYDLYGLLNADSGYT